MFNKMSSDIADQFEWILKINWTLVIDFDVTKAFLNLASTSDELVRKPKQLEVKEKNQAWTSPEEFRKDIDFGEYTSWLSCGTENMTLKEWNKLIRGSLTKLLTVLTDVNAIEDPEKIVLIIVLGSEDEIYKMSYVMKDLNAAGMPEHQVACFFKDDFAIQTFDKAVGDIFQGNQWDNQKFRVTNWGHLNSLFNNRIKTQVSYEGLLLPCSSKGLTVELRRNAVNLYKDKGMDVLGCNICEQLCHAMTPEDMTVYANQTILSFFKGAEPSWELFYFSEPGSLPVTGKIYPGVIKRALVEDLRKEVVHLSQENEVVLTKQLVHEPGSGASTIAKHVLWQLKAEMRSTRFNQRQTTFQRRKG
jgi:hypothetical protein